MSERPAGLNRLMLDFLEELEISGRSALTARNYARYLKTFREWLGAVSARADGELSSDEITPERLRHYRLYLARRRDPHSGMPIGAATRNLYQIALRQFLRYCRRRHLPVPEPNEELPLAKERDIETRYLRRDEVKRICEGIRRDRAPAIRDRALVETLFGTGVRVSELVSLTRRQVNLDTREAEVVGKGGKSRLVLFTKDAAHWLRRYLETRDDDSPYLFVSNRRAEDGVLRALSIRQVQHVVDEAARRAGIPIRVSPHVFRHSRLTALTRFKGVQVAQRIAGHSSIATTSRYLHVSDIHLKRAFDEAEEADQKEA